MAKKNFFNTEIIEPFASSEFYDKFDEGTAEGITTEVNFSIPFTDNFTTDPALETYNYSVTSYTGTFNGYVSYSEANDRIDFSFPSGVLTGYWQFNKDYRYSGNFEVEYGFSSILGSGYGTSTLEWSSRSPSGLNGVRWYIGSATGQIYRRRRLNGGSWDLTSTGVSVNSGSGYAVRLTRVGHVITFTYNIGAGWQTPASGSNVDFSPYIGVGDYDLNDWYTNEIIGNWSTTTAPVSGSFDYYKVNSASPLPEYVPAKTSPAVPVDLTENWWTISNTTGYDFEQAGTLNTTFPVADASTHIATITSAFTLSGDYDIQCDFAYTTLTAPSTSNNNPIQMRTNSGEGSNWILFFQNSSNQTGYASEGPDAGYTGPFSSDTSGKVRLTRVSGVVRAFYWSGTQWEFDGDTAGRIMDNVSTANHKVIIQTRQSPNGRCVSSISNFVINSCDKVVWLGGTLKRFTEYTGSTLLDTFNTYNTSLWQGPYSTAYAEDGVLKFRPTALTLIQRPVISQDWRLPGDFDVRFDFDEITNIYAGITGGSNYVGFLFDSAGDGTITFEQYAHNTSGGRRYYAWSNTGGNIQSATSHTSGTFRITRVSGSVRLYYWSGSQWEWGGGTSGLNFKNGWNGEARIYIRFGQGNNGTYEMNVDNFQVYSSSGITWNGAGYWTPAYMNRYDAGTFPYWTDSILKNHIEYTYTAPWTEGFTGTNGDIIDTNIWNVNGQVTIQSNGAQMYYPGSGARPNMNSKFYISGDFDIETDISNTGMVGLAGEEQDFNFRLNSVATPSEYIVIQVNNKAPTDQIIVTHSIDGSNTPATWTDSDISFRYTRVGTLVRIYYKTNASGTWIAVPDYNYNLSGDVYVSYTFWYGTASTTEWTGDIDSLTINSGTIDWNGIGEYHYVGGGGDPYTPSPYTYFYDAYTDTGGISIENHTPTGNHPSGGYYTVPTVESGNAGTIRITTGGSYMESNSTSGTTYLQCNYEFGETKTVEVFDWQWSFSGYSLYSSGGCRTYLQDASGTTMVGMTGWTSTQVRCYYPGGSIIVTCDTTVDNTQYPRKITYDGETIRYYSHGSEVYSYPYTGTMDFAKFYFWGVGVSSLNRRAHWDTMNLYINGIRP